MAGKILIVDDVATSRIVLKASLGRAFYRMSQASDGAAGLTQAAAETLDLVIVAARLPDMTGAEFCLHLRALPQIAGLPVIVVGAAGAEALSALAAGADDVMALPLDETLLLARVRSLMRAREVEDELMARSETCRDLGFSEPEIDPAGPPRIGLILADAGAGESLRAELQAHISGRIEVLDRAEALGERPDGTAPEAFVLAASSPAPDEPAASIRHRAQAVLDLMSELRSRSATRHAAILVLLPGADAATASMALDLGAGDVVTGKLLPPPPRTASAPNAHRRKRQPTLPREVALRLARLVGRKRRRERLRASVAAGLQLAVTDPLTGLYNRRYALPHLARIAERAHLSGKRFSVMVLDLDRFKAVNDTFGHAAGDAVLVAVAHALARSLRPGDLLARIGGEEFLVALPDSGLSVARTLAKRLCKLVESQPVTLATGEQVPVTLSIGLAVGDPAKTEVLDAMALVERADRALLGAKSEGRNQVTVDRSAA